MSVARCVRSKANARRPWASQRATVTDLSKSLPARHPCSNGTQNGASSHRVSPPSARCFSSTLSCALPLPTMAPSCVTAFPARKLPQIPFPHWRFPVFPCSSRDAYDICVCARVSLFSSSSVLYCRTTHVTSSLLSKTCSNSADGEAGGSDDDSRH